MPKRTRARFRLLKFPAKSARYADVVIDDIAERLRELATDNPQQWSRVAAVADLLLERAGLPPSY